MQCVHVSYTRLLEDRETFTRALYEHVSGSIPPAAGMPHVIHKVHGSSIAGLLTLIDIVFEMLLDVGLCVVHDVYTAVKRHETIEFDTADGLHVCCFSTLPSRQCLCVGRHVTVHVQYLKWLQCLWLVTHLNELERARRACATTECKTVPLHHSELYRKALRFVLEELECLYTHVSKQDRVLSTQIDT
jgi:hypothetical protein